MVDFYKFMNKGETGIVKFNNEPVEISEEEKEMSFEDFLNANIKETSENKPLMFPEYDNHGKF